MARPPGRVQRRREHDFLRSLDELGSFAEAVSASQLDPRRLVRLLDEDDFWTVVLALRVGRVTAAAVVVEKVDSRAAA